MVSVFSFWFRCTIVVELQCCSVPCDEFPFFPILVVPSGGLFVSQISVQVAFSYTKSYSYPLDVSMIQARSASRGTLRWNNYKFYFSENTNLLVSS